jgi:outer membrane protein assembly factor BamD
VKNIRNISITFLALVLGACSTSKPTMMSTGNSQFEERFKQGKTAYEKGDYLTSQVIFDEVRLQAPTSEFAAEAAFLEGMSRYYSSTYISAAVDFRAVRRNYPTSPFADRSQYMVAESYYALSPRPELDQTYTQYAINEYQTFLRDCPRAGKSLADSAEMRITELRNKQAMKILLAAELYIKLVDRKSALQYFGRVVDSYYDTPAAVESELRIAEVQYGRKKMKEAMEALEAFDTKYLSNSSEPQRQRAMRLRQQLSEK